MIENTSAILLTQDKEIISLFTSATSELQTKLVEKPDFASFILEIQENDYELAICDCSRSLSECLKWVKVIKKIRPKVPLIVISSEIDKTSGGKLYEESIYHLCEKPIHEEYLKQILTASLTKSGRRNL
jgi:DNA-binding NtrC family response regulator